MLQVLRVLQVPLESGLLVTLVILVQLVQRVLQVLLELMVPQVQLAVMGLQGPKVQRVLLAQLEVQDCLCLRSHRVETATPLLLPHAPLVPLR